MLTGLKKALDVVNEMARKGDFEEHKVKAALSDLISNEVSEMAEYYEEEERVGYELNVA